MSDIDLRAGSREREVFLEGVEFGAAFGIAWYLIWFTVAFLALDRTHEIMDIFGIWSVGGLAGFALPMIARWFVRND